MKERRTARLIFSTLSAAAALVVTNGVRSGVAHAHFNLLAPPAADTANDGGKGAPPCGPTTPSNVVTPAMGGHGLPIMITETVGHPGHYRFALADSRAKLPADPVAVVQGGISVSAPVESPAVLPVLADGVFDHATAVNGQMFQMTLMLPNITCAKCTLQVIEFMAMHGLNAGGGYYYHHCADLAITADPNLPADGGTTGVGGSTGTAGSSGTGGSGTGGSGTTTTSSGGCAIAGRGSPAASSTTSATTATGALALLALVIVRRRRRR